MLNHMSIVTTNAILHQYKKEYLITFWILTIWCKNIFYVSAYYTFKKPTHIQGVSKFLYKYLGEGKESFRCKARM